ncbi:unnamed protein product [Didymodactylos carnosus]|uniref:Mutator-like transposase domain-containing protein n=1 Tax=Didymodactylos carnosus TaxID=1234261 RepID=A0A815Z3W1_9BILA|nr:unnamed protein product [Didymodactylos carnosus]CAF4443953.1 unnamed protein product [Didymodactylos carnosus]
MTQCVVQIGLSNTARSIYKEACSELEAEGASRIFQRSVSKGLRYKWLVCDDDSTAYDKVKNIYIEQETAAEEDGIDNNDKRNQDDNELMVLKLDCINHVKKRVISRLKDIKSRNTGFQDVLRDVASTSTTVPVAHNTTKMKTDQSSCTIDKGRQPREAVRMKKTVPDGKPFRGSAGHMTDAMMHKMSEMYSLAIRQGTVLSIKNKTS